MGIENDIQFKSIEKEKKELFIEIYGKIIAIAIVSAVTVLITLIVLLIKSRRKKVVSEK